MIVSNIGVDPGFSAIYTSNSAMHTAYVQVALSRGHRVGSYEYIARVKQAMQEELPQLTPYFGSGSLVESTLNMGLAAPIDVQISGSESAGQLQARLWTSREKSERSGRGRRLHSAGSRSARAEARYRSRARPRTRLEPERSRRKRHHGTDFKPDDRAQPVDRSSQRQSLLPGGTVSRKADQEHGRPPLDSAARTRLHAAHSPRYGQQHSAHRRADGSQSLSRFEERSTFLSAARAKT